MKGAVVAKNAVGDQSLETVPNLFFDVALLGAAGGSQIVEVEESPVTLGALLKKEAEFGFLDADISVEVELLIKRVDVGIPEAANVAVEGLGFAVEYAA